jgi:hypothetical protein
MCPVIWNERPDAPSFSVAQIAARTRNWPDAQLTFRPAAVLFVAWCGPFAFLDQGMAGN